MTLEIFFSPAAEKKKNPGDSVVGAVRPEKQKRLLGDENIKSAVDRQRKLWYDRGKGAKRFPILFRKEVCVMSLLSKLLGGKKPSISDVVDLLQGKEQKPASGQTGSFASRPANPAPEEIGEETPIGRSWGERMPDEPNQYNYPGSYREYFEDIFKREFAAYRVSRTVNPRTDKTSIYTFYDGPRTALMVEIMSRRADLQELRRNCQRQGIPYLRFYYDYHGWWNARSYVVNRINAALDS